MIMNMLKSNVPSAKKKETENSWSVYIHINKINGKQYVGITSQDVKLRWQNGLGYRRNPHFNAAINKYGWSSFDHKVLHTGISHKDACKYEIEYIKQFHLKDKRYGYNLTDGGEGTTGYIYTDEQRNHISEGRKGIKFSSSHLNHMRQSAKHGGSSPKSVYVDMYDLSGKFIRRFDALSDAANYSGANKSNIAKCCRGKIKSSMGYIWRYAEITNIIN